MEARFVSSSISYTKYHQMLPPQWTPSMPPRSQGGSLVTQFRLGAATIRRWRFKRLGTDTKTK
ncbi:hypothetical protein M3J09_002372 [Ascochyta lentis]